MTEKEKMLSGEFYDGDHDDELLLDKQRAKELCRLFNDAAPNDLFAQEQVIRQLLGDVKTDFIIEQPFHCDFGYNIMVGDGFYANANCVILDEAPVTMGSNVLIGPQCCICTVSHPADAELRATGLMYARPITIGDNVWIGANVTILPGVTIGANTIIGAGSVVADDIPANVTAFGNPCRVRPTTSKTI